MGTPVAGILIFLALVAGTADADELTRAERDLFEIHVRPTLVTQCISCHGDEKQEGGLRLTSFDRLLAGGDSGPALVVGKPGESLLIEALRYESFEMPPSGQLDDEVVDGLAKWVAAGAPWPRDVVLKPTAKISDSDRQWWCFQPVRRPVPPAVEDPESCRVEIDHFVRARLAQSGIEPARPADPLTLARRVHFAITGLPPDEATIRMATSPDFDFEGLVDRLLESSAYGENQARHWLDLVRYADTDGYRADHARPEAYRYRDYVIASFNADKPYDRFIREQLAGDEIDPGNRDAITATMYLRHWIYEHNQRDVETQWHEILSDITETTADVFLAQGYKCARCHDHKFDPILQRDYYRMKAFFAAFQPVENHPVADVNTLREYRSRMAAWSQATEEIRQHIHSIENPILLKHATREGFDKFIPKIKEMIRARPEDREPYEQQIASLASRQFDLPHDKLDEWLSDSEKAELAKLRKQLSEFESIKPESLPTMKFVASDVGPVAPPTYVPDDDNRDPVAPGFMTLLDNGDAKIKPTPEPLQTTGRRTALADWIASGDNPLTARVIVNRVWQQHFGRGLVDTSSDFGHLGTPPSHPLLLDWLASRFVEDGWSLKKLHRLILTSATYRQTSLRPVDETLRSVDPGNQLLWRMNPRRLSGEEITDTVLASSGELNSQRRAIYKPVKRNTPDPLLAAFDAPDRIRSNGRRHRTTTSTQALLLANGGWLHQRAVTMVDRMESERPLSDAELVDQVYRRLFGRAPDTDELALASQFLQRYAEATPREKAPDAQFLVSMPGTGGKAVDLRADGQIAMKVPRPDELSGEEFTIEAIVLLRSLYEDATVRTIVSNWTGNKKHAGWSFGVTSTKSAYDPRNLILQLVGHTSDDGEKDDLHYEVIASGLRPELNKPYYVAATLRLSDPSEQGITFFMKDLSKKDAAMRTAHAKHTVKRGIHAECDVMIGGRFGTHRWDGLIDRLRLAGETRDLTLVAQADSTEGLPQDAVDWRFEDENNLGLDSSGRGNHAAIEIDAPAVKTQADRARIGLVHALLNSNELIYVD